MGKLTLQKHNFCAFKKELKQPFILLTLIFLTLSMPFIFLSKGTVELWINQHHTPFLDLFFKYYTNIGDGIILGVILIILLMRSYYKTILFTLTVLFSMLITNLLLKLWLFKDAVRPSKYFDGNETLNLVEGVKLHSYHSFPSGHTTTAFLWIGFLALLLPRKFTLPLFFAALLAGLSRVYILQHFFIDIYFGSLIGVTSIFLIKYLIEKYTNLAENQKYQKGLIRRAF